MLKIKNLLFIIAGNFLLACSVQWFTVPYDIPVGGATGLGIILAELTSLNMEKIVFFINLLCLPVAYFFSGTELLTGSVLSSLIYPLCLSIVKMLPDMSFVSDSLIMSTLLSGIIAGTGVGLVLKVGASNGGLDILSVVISRKTSLNLSRVMWTIDTAIMISEAFFIDISRVIYGIISAYIMIRMIDRILNNGEQKYQITVVSDFYMEIRNFILEKDEGVTMSYIEKGFEEKKGKAVISIVPIRSLSVLTEGIMDIDPEAFITVQKVYDVKGRGFTSAKLHLEK